MQTAIGSPISFNCSMANLTGLLAIIILKRAKCEPFAKNALLWPEAGISRVPDVATGETITGRSMICPRIWINQFGAAMFCG